MYFPRISQHVSTGTWPISVMPSPVPPSMPVSGRRTGEDLWLTERSMTGFGSAPARDSGFRSTCTASATPPRLSGPSAIQRTCAEQRIFSAIRPLEQRKSTTSWRSPVSRVGPSLEPLGILGNNIRRGTDGLYAGGACAILSAVFGGAAFSGPVRESNLAEWPNKVCSDAGSSTPLPLPAL